MTIAASYAGLVLIWSTTPLAIKWSNEGGGFLFGVASRMVLGVAVCLALLTLLRRPIRWHRAARDTYIVAGMGLWSAMSIVYWSAQFVPSGMISVVFGLTPLATSLLSALWLDERSFTLWRSTGMMLGVTGLALVFAPNLVFAPEAAIGILALVLAVLLHAASAVVVKRLDARLDGLETTAGTLLVAVPLFVASWWVMDGVLPSAMPRRAILSIAYLGVVGSALGFILYFHVLRHLSANYVALITLMTPVLALAIGIPANGEQVGPMEWIGTSVILIGLICYQWGDRWMRAPVREVG